VRSKLQILESCRAPRPGDNGALDTADTLEISEPMTWDEICAQYPAQRVCLVEVDRIDPNGFEFRTARVIGHGKTRREAFERARPGWRRYDEIANYFTGRMTVPPMRPQIVLDDELRELLRDHG